MAGVLPLSLSYASQRALTALTGTPFGEFRRRLATAHAGAAHVEFWRKSSEGRYRRSSCNERTDPGSISSVSPLVPYELFPASCKERTDFCASHVRSAT